MKPSNVEKCTGGLIYGALIVGVKIIGTIIKDRIGKSMRK